MYRFCCDLSRWGRHALCLLIIGLLAIGTPLLSRADEPIKEADVIIRSVSVKSTKASGNDWDVGGGAPDLKVYIEVSSLFGSTHTTSVKHDTYFAEFNEKSIRVKVGDTIKIIVYDEDALADDVVGTYTKQITADTFKDRNPDWSFGQVASIQLKFEP